MKQDLVCARNVQLVSIASTTQATPSFVPQVVIVLLAPDTIMSMYVLTAHSVARLDWKTQLHAANVLVDITVDRRVSLLLQASVSEDISVEEVVLWPHHLRAVILLTSM